MDTKNSEHQPSKDSIAVKAETEIESNNIKVANDAITLYPFMCGLCESKFSSISMYFYHLQLHSNVNTYLHCCSDTDVEQLCTCGVCGLKYPTVCTLYQHLLEEENLDQFVFRRSDKTAYAQKEMSKSHFQDPCPVDIVGTIARHCNDEMDIESDCTLDNSFISSATTIKPPDKDNNINEEQTIIDTVCEVQDEESITCITRMKYTKSKNNSCKKHANTKVRGSHTCGKTKTESRTDRCNVTKDVSTTLEKQKLGNNEELDNDTQYSAVADRDNELPSKDIKDGLRIRDCFFPCEVCGGIYKYDSLVGHRAVHAERSFTCDQCHLKFSSKERLNNHKSYVHASEKSFTCHECGKCFAAMPYLRQHSGTHLKERNIQCPSCPKTFRYKNELRIHLLSHSEEKPHQCNICGKGFKRMSEVVKHKEGVHEATDKYQCPKCSKWFTTKGGLGKHRLIHLPPKHFCKTCGKSFIQAYNVKIHMKVH